MHISERDLQLPEQAIEKLIQIQAEEKGILSLGPGEPDFPAPKPIVALTKKFANRCNHYAPPGGFLALRQAICKKLKRDNKINAEPDNIVVTCGSQEALLISTAVCCDVSEQMIIPNPSFMSYLPVAEMFEAVPVSVELKEEAEYEINPDAVAKAIDPRKTKVLIINSPANPTGNLLSRAVLEQLADIAIEHDLLIFSDEAYEKIIYDNAKHISIGSLNGMSNHVLTFQSFSKTYAMCGYRLGYVCAPESIATEIKRRHVDTSICAPTISQLIGTKALSLPSKYTDSMVKIYNQRRKIIVKRLNEMGLSTPMPKGAFYTFSDISHLSNNSKKFAFDLLKKEKVAVVPGRDFGSHGEGHIRCSYTTDIKIIEKAMNRLERFVSKMRKKII